MKWQARVASVLRSFGTSIRGSSRNRTREAGSRLGDQSENRKNRGFLEPGGLNVELEYWLQHGRLR